MRKSGSHNKKSIVFRVIALGIFIAARSFTGSVLADNVDHHAKLAVNQVEGDLFVMVLGSGGPLATAAGRASTPYSLEWLPHIGSFYY